MPTQAHIDALGLAMAADIKTAVDKLPAGTGLDAQRQTVMKAQARGVLTQLELGLGATAWTSLITDLGPNWSHFGGHAAPAYRRDADGWVSLRGSVTGGSLGSVILTLPAGFRPSSNEAFICAAGAFVAGVFVYLSGNVELMSFSGSGTPTYVSLSGIRFHPTPPAPPPL